MLRTVSRILDGRSSASIREISRSRIAQGLAIHFRPLSYYVEHAVLQRLLVLRQEVLLPRVVTDVGVQVVPLEALLEEAQAVLVIGLFLELEAAAIDHVVVELLGHSVAEILEPGF